MSSGRSLQDTTGSSVVLSLNQVLASRGTWVSSSGPCLLCLFRGHSLHVLFHSANFCDIIIGLQFVTFAHSLPISCFHSQLLLAWGALICHLWMCSGNNSSKLSLMSHGLYFCIFWLHHFMCQVIMASLIAQLMRNPPAMQETLVLFLGQEDRLEKGWAIHSSILGLPLWLSCWRIRLQCGRPGLIPGSGMAGEGKGPLQDSGWRSPQTVQSTGLRRVGQGSHGAACVLPEPGSLSGPTVPKSSFYFTPVSLHKHLPGGLVDQLGFLRYRKSPKATLTI